MSGAEESDEIMMCCASCGTAQADDIQLKTCTACKSVRYCSVKCQKEHRPQHKRACKKRAAELRDELLFRQPESSHEARRSVTDVYTPMSCEYFKRSGSPL
eukprot:scaffold1799_cov134-Skeletonema_dohrnii-CCMP3373.AAC.1